MSLAWPFIVLIGGVIGVLVGITGTGGAFLIPALVYIFRAGQLRAQGTALLIAASPIWIIPLIPYYRAGHFDWKLGLLLACGLAIGSYFGATWVQSLPVATVRKTFAVVLMLLALRMFFQR